MSKKRKRRKMRTQTRTKARRKPPPFQRRELKLEELAMIIERTESGPLGAEDREKLLGAVDTLAFLTQEIEAKGTSINRLRKLIFGASTEKTSQVVGETAVGTPSEVDDTSSDSSTSAASDEVSAQGDEPQDKPKPKRKGHGKNGAHTRAQQDIEHRRGRSCPEIGDLHGLAAFGAFADHDAA